MKDNQVLRVGIHGLGRIGRTFLRSAQQFSHFQVVVACDISDTATMHHLLKYDSIHGRWDDIQIDEFGGWNISGQPLHYHQKLSKQETPPWEKWNVDVVLESTGNWKTRAQLETHLSHGAKKVLLSAPPEEDTIPMVVLGINDAIIKNQDIVSCASCTTNSAAHMIELIHSQCQIESCYITTVHSYTGDQRLHDAPHKDLRRSRGALQSIVPTSTGAAKALTRIFPELANNLGGCGMRVPVPDGSLTDITSIVKNPLTIEQINAAFYEAAETKWKGLVQYTSDPIVSSDVIGNAHSCLFDSSLTSVIGKMVKVVGWYDNEVGYSHRLCDVIKCWGDEKI
jgi:glyceraldehyde 3-phosphate dehydrogenase